MPASSYLSYKSIPNNSLNTFIIFNELKDMLKNNQRTKLRKYLKNIKPKSNKIIKNKNFKSKTKIILTINSTSIYESFENRITFYKQYYKKYTDKELTFKDKTIPETYWVNDLEVGNVLWDIMKDKENEERTEAHRIAMEKKAELERIKEEKIKERENLRIELQEQEKIKLQKLENLRLDRLKKDRIKKLKLEKMKKEKEDLRIFKIQQIQLQKQARENKIIEDLKTNHINRIKDEQLAISYYTRDIKG